MTPRSTTNYYRRFEGTWFLNLTEDGGETFLANNNNDLSNCDGLLARTSRSLPCSYNKSPLLLILSQMNPVHHLLSYLYWYILILSSIYVYVSPSNFFLSSFPTKIVYSCVIFHTRALCPAYPPPFIGPVIWWLVLGIVFVNFLETGIKWKSSNCFIFPFVPFIIHYYRDATYFFMKCLLLFFI
jgi:hypothetical protein